MMLVVPLSSCITDGDELSHGNTGILGVEFPKEPETPVTPENYKIVYHGNNNEEIIKSYNGTFAYAARLPDGWEVPDKVFAGWSKNPNSTNLTDVDYLIYDDIKYDEVTGIPIDADSSSIPVLNLYAVWITPADGKLNTVYLSGDGDDTEDGKTESTAVKTFEKAYYLLDPDGTTTTNRIIVIGDYKITNNDVKNELELGHEDDVKKATICGYNNESKLSFNNPPVGKINVSVVLRDDTVFENITFDGNCVQAFIYCYGNNLTMGEDIKSSSIGEMSDYDKETYAIPAGYPAFTILGGCHGKDTTLSVNDKVQKSEILDPNKHINNELKIRLISGDYGRVSGFGRGYEPTSPTSLESLCPTLIVYGTTKIGTLAAGHLDSNATTGVNDDQSFKTAKVFVRSISDNDGVKLSPHIVNLVGGNIGNNKESTFIGDVEISIFDGTIENIYGAGLGRTKGQIDDGEKAPQTSMAGSVTIYLCGGEVTKDFYGGGAAAALSSAYATAINSSINIDSKTKIIISGGAVNGNVYGGGYGNSKYLDANYYDDPRLGKVSAGTIVGDTCVAVLGGTIGTSNDPTSGNIFGGGKGATNTDDSASVTGDTTVLIFNGSIFGSVYGGGEGIDSYENIAKVTDNTSIYILNGNISENVYGGGKIGVVGGRTDVVIAGGIIGDETHANETGVFGGGEGHVGFEWAGSTNSTNVTVTGNNPIIYGNIYGGGNLGPVGTLAIDQTRNRISLSGGSANVTISSGNIHGSVFGGGKGQYDEIANNKLVLGAVQSTTVNILGGIIHEVTSSDNSKTKGNVYGGGELGLVGKLDLPNDAGTPNVEATNFTKGSANVTISSGNIHGSVYGGGKGVDGATLEKYQDTPLVTIILGSVASTTHVEISGGTIGTADDITNKIYGGNVYGGGELGIVGNYQDSTVEGKDYRTYAGGNSAVIISGGTVLDSVYGGGTGTLNNVLAGAVGNSNTLICGNTSIHNSVYGGGAYALSGDVKIDRSPNSEGNVDPKIVSSENTAQTNVIVLGGTIGTDSNPGNIFGGGYGPKAVIAGSTHVYLGKSNEMSDALKALINGVVQTDIIIKGSVYGGGEMGSVGFIDLASSDNGNSYRFSESYQSKINETANISSNVFITGNGSNSIIIGNDKNLFENTNERIGNVYGGGKGGDLTINGKTYKGYAIVHGSSNLTITGKQGNSIHIYGDVFGGGQGIDAVKQPGNTEAILYAAVTQSSNISIFDVNIYHNVYGGGELSIVGWYYDDNKLNVNSESNTNKDYRHFTGGPSVVIISDSIINKNVYGGGTGTPANALSGAVGKTTVIISDSSAINLETEINGNIYGGGAYSIVGNFTVDRTSGADGTVIPKIVSSTNDSESNVIVLGGTIGSKSDSGSGNIFGGGYGPKAVIAGSTHVYLGKSEGMNTELKTLINRITQTDITINGSVYGGGEMGAVGFEYYEGETIASVINGISSNVVITSDSKSIKVNGNVYGGGKGWDLEVIKDGNNVTGTNEIKPGKDVQDSSTVLHGYAIVHGNTVVNISGENIIIDKCVYGGGEGVLLDGAIITTPGDNYGEIDYEKVLGSLPYGQVTGNNDAGASVTINGANIHENVYGGGNTGLIGTYTKTSQDDNKYAVVYTGKPVSVIITNATIGVEDASGHISQNGGDDLTTGNVFGAGKGNDEGTLLGAVGKSTVTIINSHIVKVTEGSDEKAKALSGHVYGGGDYGIVGSSVNVQVNLNYNYDTGSYNPFEAHKVINYITIKDIITVLISGTSKIDGNVYGGGKGTFDSHTPEGGVIIDPSNPDEGLIEPTMSAGYGTVYGSVKVTMSGGTVSGNVYGGGKGSLNETGVDGTKNENILNSIPYGQITGLDSSKMSPPVTNEQISTPSIAASVLISGGTVKGSVFGGGQLGILGTFNKDTGYFNGKDSLVVIFSADNSNVKVECSVFGGGEGSSSSAISGIVNNTTVIIGKGAVIGKNAGADGKDYTKEVIGETTLRLYYGNVYGGGKLSVVGNVTVDENDVARVKASAEGTPDNTARTDVIILGGDIKHNVYGGGFSPKASIAGSTHVWIGEYAYSGAVGSPNINNSLTHVGAGKNEDDLKYIIEVKGSVFGGGEMGAVGSSVIDLDSITDKSELVSADVSIKSDLNNITIGSKDANGNPINGNIFGGGEGIQNYADGPIQGGWLDIEISGIKGYAIVRGSAYVEINGDSNNISNLTINGSIYGGGKGVQYNVESIHYAEVYDSAAVKVSNADIKGNVYGGGKMSIVGHFYDAYPVDGTPISWYNTNGTKTATYYVKLDGGKAYLVDGSGDYITVESGSITTTTDLNKRLLVTYRYFCSDYADGITGIKTTKDIPQYEGKGTAAVLITDSKVAGNVFGGGEGADTNILAGAVGRGTVVTIDDSSGNNSKTEICGNVYGGGKLGIVGSIMTQIIGTGGIGTDTFSTTKVSHIVHSKIGMTNLEEDPNLDSANNVDLVVNILGGHIKGSVFGAGKGEQVYYEGVPYPDATRISYYKLSVFGRTEVNVSNGIIDKHVYGGSENGETGSLTVLKKVKEFADGYWDSNPYGDNRRGAPSDIPKEVRDKGYKVGENTITPNLPTFSAAFVNIVGGTVYGNVFGGGYFGAVHGNTHVHIGWNAMMPDGDTKGDCHYYNDYGDKNYRKGGHLPFVERSKEIIKLGDVILDENSNPKSLTKENTVHNLFLNGTVFAGGDRGDPSATTINYDYISVYGTSHIFLNGAGYVTGTDANEINAENGTAAKHAMYVQGSLFGSGNSCTTFYSDKANSRFITIKNYNAINDDKLNNFIIYSIQRATEVTLINSSLRLPGRSDGSNVNTSALYSLNHVKALILRGGSALVLDTEVNDLREFRSVDGLGANTSPSNPTNTLQLNNGIILIIAQNEEELNTATSPVEEETLNGNESADVSEAAEAASLIRFIFGPVNGYSYISLDHENSDYFGGYIYGEFLSGGGFVYDSSFGSLHNTKVNVIHYESKGNNLGYDVWKPAGGIVSSSATLIADENKMNDETKSKTQEGFYEATGSVTLPMTESGSIYELRGYNINPSQAFSLADRSLKLLPVNDKGEFIKYDPSSADTDFGLLMSLNEKTFTGSIEGGISSVWIDPTVDKFGQKTSAGAVGGNVLPQIDFTLYYGGGITKTGIAGEVVIYLQERLPVRDSAGIIIDYLYGDQIKVILTIQTQNVAESTEDGNLSLYPHSIEGTSSWYFVVPPIMGTKQSLDASSYEFTLKSVSVSSGIKLNGKDTEPAGNDQYQLIMSAVDNQNRSHGWSGYSLQNQYLKNDDTYDNFVGVTDGRFGATLQFTLVNKTGEETYVEGTVVIKFNLVLYDKNGDMLGKNQELTLNIHIKNRIPSYTVDFVTSPQASYVPSQTVDSGSKVKKPQDDPSMIVSTLQNAVLGDNVILGDEAPTLSNLQFGGWYTDETYTTLFDFTKPVYEDMKAYALFGCTVTFNSNGGSFIDTKTITYGTAISKPKDPTNNGYTFNGWYLDGIIYNFSSPVLTNITLKAQWDVADVHVEYNMNGAAGLNAPTDNNVYDLNNNSTTQLSSQYGSDKTATINGVNCKFGGWALTPSNPSAIYSSSDNVKLSDIIDSAVQIGNDYKITFYAVWIPESNHLITINASPEGSAGFTYLVTNGAGNVVLTGSYNGPFSVKSGSTVTITYNAADGYEHEENKNKTGTTTIGDITKDQTVTVKFTAIPFNVTLDANGGTFSGGTVNTIQVKPGENYPTLAEPTWDNHTFLGWFTAREGGTQITSNSKVIPSVKTLYAHWDAVKFSVKFYYNDTGFLESKVSYGSTIYLPVEVDPFVKEGHKLAGWKLDDSGSLLSPGSEYKPVKTDLSFYAQWEEVKTNLTVIFNPNGGTLTGSDTVTVKHGASIGENNMPKNPTRVGYEFLGWFTSPDGSTEFTSSYKVTKDIEVYAHWSKLYTITFDSNDGSHVDSIIKKEGTKITKPADPTKQGYIFAGWYEDDGTFQKEFIFNTMPSKDITLYAKWIEEDDPDYNFKVEYNANGGEGEVPGTESHYAGSMVTVKPADLKNNECYFLGWQSSADGKLYQAGDQFRMPFKDVCLTAIWSSSPIGDKVTVTFCVDNETYASITINTGTSLNERMPSVPSKEGFDFLGWYTEDGKEFTSETKVYADITVYAKWNLNEDYVLVTYIIDNEIYMTLACKKSMITEPYIPDKSGKELNGWYTDKELKNKFSFDTIINEDSLTLYAEWKNNSNFMILFIFALFAGFMAAVIASTKRISFYENKNDEEKYASVIIIGKGTLKDRLPSHSNSNFEGWYSESGELITEDTEITQSMKVYAHWKE